MNKFKALVVDFDGTLVDSSLKISPIVEDSIKNLIARGFLFSTATARPFQGIIEKVCNQLSLNNPVIVRVGAEIFNPETKLLIWSKYIQESELKKLIKYCLENNQDLSVESGNEIFVYGLLPSTAYTSGMKIKDIKEASDLSHVSKVILRNIEEEKLPKIKQTINDEFKELNVEISLSPQRKSAVLDITSKETNKKIALYKFAELTGIKSEQIVGIGDGYNDQQLLSACGYKVAMQNAPKELKKMANIIVGPAEENGIVEAIERIFIKNSYGSERV